MPPLPEPSPAAIAISEQLTELIASDMEMQGWMDFSRYMTMALYTPGLGYYSAGAIKFGTDGDFVTAPEVSPLFGHSLAQQIAQVLEISGGDVLELGAGSGRLACDVLTELQHLDCLPQHYFILEVSADLRARQQRLIAGSLPELAARLIWLDELPATFIGCIIANEVLDAVPTEVLRWAENDIYQRGVSWDGRRFDWRERELPQGPLRELAAAISVPPDYVSEINPAARNLVRTLAQSLKVGAMIMIDYGFGEREYYHPQRAQGTLMCHYRQHAHGDPFYLPGLQDITAHVDFSAMALAGIEAGLSLAGYTSQAQFLINCGITGLLARTPAAETASYLPRVAAAQKLLSPAEMGELFKVLAWTRGIEVALLGFAQNDQRRRL